MKMPCTYLLFLALLLQGCQPHDTLFSTAPDAAVHPVQAPGDVVASLNRLYVDTQQNDCRELGTNLPRGHYYCSGVLLRGTSDGDYLPWLHSPASIEKGSTSFSWIRADLGTSVTFRPSGFILRNATEGNRLGLPGYDEGFICLYPFDAETGSLTIHQGCGHKVNTIQATYPQPGHPPPQPPIRMGFV